MRRRKQNLQRESPNSQYLKSGAIKHCYGTKHQVKRPLKPKLTPLCKLALTNTKAVTSSDELQL